MVKRGVPAFEVIGSQADIAKFTKDTLPALKEKYGGNVIFAAIDKDKVDPHSDLGRLTNLMNFSSAYTRLVTLNDDNQGHISGENVVTAGWGKDILKQAKDDMPTAKKQAEAEKSKIKLSDSGVAGKRPDASLQPITAQAMRESSNKIKAELEAARSTKDVLKFEAHYLAAIAEADKFSIKQLEGETKRIEAAKKTAGTDAERLALTEQEQQVKSLQKDKFNTRFELGSAYGKSGLSEVGREWILSAGQRDHSIFQPGAEPLRAATLTGALKGAKFSNQDIQYMARESQTPKWKQIQDDALPEKVPEKHDVVDKLPKRDKMQEFTDKQVAEALKAAKDNRLPLVIDIGGGFKPDGTRDPKDCIWCAKLDQGTMPKIKDEYKDKAILLKVDAKRASKLVKELGLENAPWPTLLVATVKDDHGKLKVDRLPGKEGLHSGFMTVEETEKFLGQPLGKATKLMEKRFEPMKREPSIVTFNHSYISNEETHKSDSEYLMYHTDRLYG